MNGRAPFSLMTQLALPLAILLPLGIAAKPQLEEVLGPASGLHSPFGVAFDDQGNAWIDATWRAACPSRRARQQQRWKSAFLWHFLE